MQKNLSAQKCSVVKAVHDRRPSGAGARNGRQSLGLRDHRRVHFEGRTQGHRRPRERSQRLAQALAIRIRHGRERNLHAQVWITTCTSPWLSNRKPLASIVNPNLAQDCDPGEIHTRSRESPRARHFAGTEFRLAGLWPSCRWCRCRTKGLPACSRHHSDGLLNAADRCRTSRPRNRPIWC
jgi:hypothetical protein